MRMYPTGLRDEYIWYFQVERDDDVSKYIKTVQWDAKTQANIVCVVC